MTKRNTVFLGLCKRAEHDIRLNRWNVLDLSPILPTHIFPMSLYGFYLAIAFPLDAASEASTLRIEYADGEELLKLDYKASIELNQSAKQQQETGTEGLIWQPWFARLDISTAVIKRPATFFVFQECNGEKKQIGTFEAVFIEPPHLTPERISAIQSDPGACKSARIVINCTVCRDEHKSYYGLERIPKLETEGWIWSPELDDSWKCGCGATEMPLVYLKMGFSSVLGRRQTSSANLSVEPLYKKSVLENIRYNFVELLEQSPREEEVQKFIKENTILLYTYSATKIIPKPSIGTKFKADFGILDTNNDLNLVEIERPGLRLLKQDGHRTSGLTHAFDQVGDWLNEIEIHRIAILEGMGLQNDHVNKIRGVVIAGRDSGHDAGHLRKLRMRPNDGFAFYTYDDLISTLDNLIQSIDDM
ncbi:Shedu anti-phage system protein SduA domain-containing protein [Hoeflea sp. TYP-13]|uniref:Shedu anti-phage system protein SduA domain-containing protein n=1 Tax=Hoeflea sp. TYP-13 TaxID=3230023 RepID=UPI0034C638A4